MPLKRKIVAVLVCLLVVTLSYSQQVRFSLATDFSMMRSLKEGQRYWGIGQTVVGQLNFSPKDAAYAWICYYSDGNFTNYVTAYAKSPSTTPQTIPFDNVATMDVKQISLGWKHYLVGSTDAEDGLNLYGILGLGLMFGTVNNAHSVLIDSSLYNMPVLPGEGKFKRLTYDLGLGVERPLSSDIYLYFEGRMLIPSYNDYPGNYLVVYHDAPLVGTLSVGLRLFFD